MRMRSGTKLCPSLCYSVDHCISQECILQNTLWETAIGGLSRIPFMLCYLSLIEIKYLIQEWAVVTSKMHIPFV